MPKHVVPNREDVSWNMFRLILCQNMLLPIENMFREMCSDLFWPKHVPSETEAKTFRPHVLITRIKTHKNGFHTNKLHPLKTKHIIITFSQISQFSGSSLRPRYLFHNVSARFELPSSDDTPSKILTSSGHLCWFSEVTAFVPMFN